MSALYAITNAYIELAEKLSGLDLDAQTVADTIEASGIIDDFNVKAQALIHIASEAERYTPSIDAEIERLQALKVQRAKVAQGVREYLKSNMERSGITKITCPLFSISIKQNPPSVEVDTASLPDAYWRTPEPKPPTPAPDKVAIKQALQAGTDVPGARLIQSTRLDIR